MLNSVHSLHGQRQETKWRQLHLLQAQEVEGERERDFVRVSCWVQMKVEVVKTRSQGCSDDADRNLFRYFQSPVNSEQWYLAGDFHLLWMCNVCVLHLLFGIWYLVCVSIFSRSSFSRSL